MLGVTAGVHPARRTPRRSSGLRLKRLFLVVAVLSAPIASGGEGAHVGLDALPPRGGALDWGRNKLISVLSTLSPRRPLADAASEVQPPAGRAPCPQLPTPRRAARPASPAPPHRFDKASGVTPRGGRPGAEERLPKTILRAVGGGPTERLPSSAERSRTPAPAPRSAAAPDTTGSADVGTATPLAAAVATTPGAPGASEATREPPGSREELWEQDAADDTAPGIDPEVTRPARPRPVPAAAAPRGPWPFQPMAPPRRHRSGARSSAWPCSAARTPRRLGGRTVGRLSSGASGGPLAHHQTPGCALPPSPSPSRTKWTRLVHPSVLIGHV